MPTRFRYPDVAWNHNTIDSRDPTTTVSKKKDDSKNNSTCKQNEYKRIPKDWR